MLLSSRFSLSATIGKNILLCLKDTKSVLVNSLKKGCKLAPQFGHAPSGCRICLSTHTGISPPGLSIT